jgi:hypothetical protein
MFSYYVKCKITNLRRSKKLANEKANPIEV